MGAAFAAGVANPVAAPAANSAIGDPNAAGLALQLCQAGGNLSVRGSLEATYNSNVQSRTVNVLPLEDYIVGVVPNESPAYWGQLGSPGPQGYPWGFQELEAQAVAARSYVMAALGSYGGYADTCDLSCQTYRGLKNESAITDAATLDTQGWVMEESGRIMTTEYSASSGGYTAPGTFPAVPDNGDAICPPGVNGACNPNHTWKASIPVSSIQSTWPQLGTLLSISFTSRNGFGDLGGRVLSMTLVGSSQNVVVTGDQFAADFNLLSNWFALSTTLPAPTVAMSSTSDGKGYWINAADGSLEAFGDATFYGSPTGIPLAAPVVGMASTPDNKGYWEVASDGGIFCYRRRRVLRLDRGHAPEPSHRRHGPDPERPRLLAGGLGRRDLQLRRRRVLRLDRGHDPEPAHRRHGRHTRRPRRLLAGGLRRRDLRLRRRRDSSARWAPTHSTAHRRDDLGTSRHRLPVGGLGRRDLLLRERRILRFGREPHPGRARRRAWPGRRTATATGWPPPTAGSSATGTPASTVPRPADRRGTRRRWQRQMGGRRT